MRMYDLILKKRNGEELSEEQITWIVESYVNGEIPDYQMAAFLMAVYFVGMSKEETLSLTKSMVRSGDVVNTECFGPYVVDKHSTGGVGDTTSLIVCPLVAAAGATVPKMSGRGLGHTGGTLDKLESFPGLKVEQAKEFFIDIVQRTGIAIVSQTQNLAPADKLLYSLRDATATVDSIPLIASSIMSKKLAAGAPSIVLDVKVGKGAFMTTISEAQELAHTMVQIGRRFGRRISVVLSAMDAPLGRAIGNILEVKEAIEVLNGNGSQDLTELCLSIGSEMLLLSGICPDHEQARDRLERILASGKGVLKLAEMVTAMGGDEHYVYEPEKFPRAKYVQKVRAERSGYINGIDALTLGAVAMKLGAGRARKEDTIDLTAGILLKCHLGTWVNAGDVIAELHTNKREELDYAISLVQEAFELSQEPPEQRPLILDIVR